LKTLVVLPTYNEAGNIAGILDRVLSHGIFDVLVVDDNSQDGTRDIVRGLMDRHDNVQMLERPGKMGLGTAYTTGFKWGLEHGYGCMMEMDSDFSHNPDDMPRFVEAVKGGAHLVIGSRYIGGTISVIGWDFKRLLLSRFGNIYASHILGVPLTDMTSGFRAYTRLALEGIDLESIYSEGYSFQIEMAYYVWCMGLRVEEVPIVFTERAQGSSKMSRNIVREAVKLPWRLRVRKMMGGIACTPASRTEQNGGKQL
jgi:dolichol-phosphate mannosyltransferase